MPFKSIQRGSARKNLLFARGRSVNLSRNEMLGVA
jgi:hypothetical protein